MKAIYKGEEYNIETIYFYDEYVTLYKGCLLETDTIKVKLTEVKLLGLCNVSCTFKAKISNELTRLKQELSELENDEALYDKDLVEWIKQVNILNGEIKAMTQALNYC